MICLFDSLCDYNGSAPEKVCEQLSPFIYRVGLPVFTGKTCCDLFRAVFGLVGVRGDHDLQIAIAWGAVEEVLARIAMERGSVIWEKMREKSREEILSRFVFDGILIVEVRRRG